MIPVGYIPSGELSGVPMEINPRVDNTCDKRPYMVKEEDITGDLTGIPIEIVQLMVKRQFEQTGRCDISLFQGNLRANLQVGGFTWIQTKEGLDAWTTVISNTGILKRMVPVLRNAFKAEHPTYVYVTNNSSIGDPNVYERRVLVTLNNESAYTWEDISKIEDITKAIRVVRWNHYLTKEEYDRLKNGIVELTIEEIEKKLKLKAGSLKIKESKK